MKKETFDFLFDADQSYGLGDASLLERYSGRGMNGSETIGLETESQHPQDILSAALAYLLDDPEGASENLGNNRQRVYDEISEGLKVDNMGRGYVIY